MSFNQTHLSNNKTFYEILELDNNATEEEIKKAYRRLSLQYHPDRNPSPEASDKIRDINTAYETLGDTDSRKKYDRQLTGRGGFDGFDGFGDGGGMGFPPHHRGGGGGGGGGQPMFFHTNFGNGGEHTEFANLGNIFEAIFNGGIHPDLLHQHIHQQINKPMPIIMNIEISFTQAYSGCVYPLEVNKVEVLNGKQTQKTEKLHITIPEGMDTGELIILREQGNQINGVKGDIKIMINVQKDENNIAEMSMERNEINLLFKKEISLKEALCGFSFNIKHLNGSSYCIKNTSIITPGQKQVIPKLGMKREGGIGALVIEYTIVFPTGLDDLKKEMLKEIL